MTKNKILIVEDDKKIAEALKDYLIEVGYDVLIFKSGNNVVRNVQINPPDVILLDIMLPGKDGMTICREIRSFSDIPILMITSRVEEVDRLVGLELGADDYICKPFSLREVAARIKAVIRRIYPQRDEKKIVMGEITIHEKSRKVTVGEAPINLTPTEYELLRIMMTEPDRVFTRNDLISMIQGYDYDGYDRTIDNHIKNLRKKINEHLRDQEIISTVHRIGYIINSKQSD